MNNAKDFLENLNPHEESHEEIPMLVVHVSKEEQTLFDQMQGGAEISPELGIKSYKKLGEMFETIPEIREIFLDIANEVKKEPHGKAEHALSEISEDIDHPKAQFTPAPADFNPYEKEIADEGRNGDDELAWFPESLADFFDEVRGGQSINPKTKLREYGKKTPWWRKAISIAAPILGAVMGGPLGGAIGGALGGISAPGKGGIGKVLPYVGMGALGGAAAQGLGLTSGIGSNIAESIGLGGISNSLNSITAPWLGLSGASTAGAASSVPTYLNTAQLLAGNTAPNLSSIAANVIPSAPAASGWWGGIKDLVTNPYAILGAGAGLMYMGNKQGEKEHKKYEEELRRREEEKKAAMGRYVDSIGFFKPLDSSTSRKWRRPNPEAAFHDPYNFDSSPQYYTYDQDYAKGGKVKDSPVRDIHITDRTFYFDGPEKGQDDNLYGDAEPGSFVFDASTTSDLGDGNSHAGALQVKKLIDHFSHQNYEDKEPMAKGGVPVAVSSGEGYVPRQVLANIGKGSSTKGAHVLRNIVTKVRKEKRSNPNSLPKKAKDILDYLPRNIGVAR